MCHWTIEDTSEFTALYHTGCGVYQQERLPKYFNFKFCPHCGSPIYGMKSNTGERLQQRAERLELALKRIINTRCKMLEPCTCCDADANIAREALKTDLGEEATHV